MSVVEQLLVEEKPLAVDLQPFDPVLWTGVPGWHVGKQDSIAIYLVKINLHGFMLKSMAHAHERAISTREKLKRLEASSLVLMTGQVFQTIYRNPESFPLEWRTEEGSQPLDICFDGTEIVSPEGHKHRAALRHHKGSLSWRFISVDDLPRARTPSLVLSNPFARRQTA